jgi:hypothetical protein
MSADPRELTAKCKITRWCGMGYNRFYNREANGQWKQFNNIEMPEYYTLRWYDKIAEYTKTYPDCTLDQVLESGSITVYPEDWQCTCIMDEVFPKHCHQPTTTASTTTTTSLSSTFSEYGSTIYSEQTTQSTWDQWRDWLGLTPVAMIFNIGFTLLLVGLVIIFLYIYIMKRKRRMANSRTTEQASRTAQPTENIPLQTQHHAIEIGRQQPSAPPLFEALPIQDAFNPHYISVRSEIEPFIAPINSDRIDN